MNVVGKLSDFFQLAMYSLIISLSMRISEKATVYICHHLSSASVPFIEIETLPAHSFAQHALLLTWQLP